MLDAHGAIYRATKPTYTDGQRVEPQFDTRGKLLVALANPDSTTATAVLTPADAQARQSGLAVVSQMQAFNGASMDMVRVANVFKSLNAVVVTTETTIWTPAAGKKFRLLGMLITQGVVTGAVTLKDNTAGSTIAIVPPNTIGVAMPLILFGNGILSAAANNVLTATGASTETITGIVFGTEE